MQMVRFLFLWLGLITLVGCSQSPDYDIPKRQSPAIWMVENAKTGARGYVLGSVHMLPDGLDWTSGQIRMAAADSDVLITETGGGAVPDGYYDVMASDEPVGRLESRLNEVEFARAELLMTGAGLSEDDLQRTESWAIALILTRAQAADLGIATEFGVEAQLRSGLMRDKPHHGLETAKDQYQRFDALPDSAQAAMLRLSLRETNARADFQETLTAWLSGDVDALAAQTGKGMMADPALRMALLDAPNAQWANQIARHIDAGDRPFVVVGSAHVLGENNVLTHLARQGFLITRIP